jgi:hypothetical protein
MTRHLHPIEALILTALALLWAVRELLVALVAMAMLLTGWRPAAAPVALQQPSPPPRARPWLPPVWAALEALPVAELRRIARTLHLPRTLTRNGRRADLLPALAGAAMAL